MGGTGITPSTDGENDAQPAAGPITGGREGATVREEKAAPSDAFSPGRCVPGEHGSCLLMEGPLHLDVKPWHGRTQVELSGAMAPLGS